MDLINKLRGPCPFLAKNMIFFSLKIAVYVDVLQILERLIASLLRYNLFHTPIFENAHKYIKYD